LLQKNGFLILKTVGAVREPPLPSAGAEPPTPALASQEDVGAVQSFYGLFSHFPASLLSSAAPETDLCQSIYSAHIQPIDFSLTVAIFISVRILQAQRPKRDCFGLLSG